jgi:hypothetical protein
MDSDRKGFDMSHVVVFTFGYLIGWFVYCTINHFSEASFTDYSETERMKEFVETDPFIKENYALFERDEFLKLYNSCMEDGELSNRDHGRISYKFRDIFKNFKVNNVGGKKKELLKKGV